MANETEKKLGYAFNYVADIGAGQQFQITGSLPVDVTEGEIDKEFTKFRNVIERNRRRSKIPDLKKDLSRATAATGTARDQLAKLDASTQAAKNTTTAEKQARQQLLASLEHEERAIEVAQAELAEIEKELEG